MPEELSDEVMNKTMGFLEKYYIERGIDISKNPELNKFFYDQKYRAEIIKKTQENYKKSYKIMKQEFNK